MPTRSELANAIRFLSMDAVQKANSGHPGAPMGMADIAEVLWRDHLQHNPKNPNWLNRDRFVLSNGHGSMLLYALLHLTGYDVSIDDIKNFRQLHSNTPGHPEYGDTVGVETTTGPLGQGIANAVGMALAEKTLAAEFNRDELNVVDHHTYAFLGDGCLMEGISHEVCSLAGTLQLGKLIAFYDDNDISIDGNVEGWFRDDTPKRFEAYGWHVVANVDGHDADAIIKAIEAAKASDKPSLICCKTTIGFGAPNKAGSESVHGAPLGDTEIAASREALSWPHAPFEIPSDIQNDWSCVESGIANEAAWQEIFAAYEAKYPELARELLRRVDGKLPANFEQQVDEFIQTIDQAEESIASRKASLNALNYLGPMLPELLGGSADLTGSNLTQWKTAEAISAEKADGQYIYYGVREFGMSAIMNGIALHGGFIPFGGTFLVFMEYARNAVRMASLMKQRSIFVYTHDSIGLGEDGPTHQPIEQLTALRSTPNLDTWRPADAVEAAVSWKMAILRDNGPSALIFSRQSKAHQIRTAAQIKDIEKGGYVLFETAADKTPDLIFIATGSEVALAVGAAKTLAETGKNIRVVSMPCVSTFERQDSEYRESVLPKTATKRIAVEAGHGDFWYKYVGLEGAVISIDRFGASAPGPVLFEHFGFTETALIEKAKSLV